MLDNSQTILTRSKEHQIHDKTQQAHPGIVCGAEALSPDLSPGEGVSITAPLYRPRGQIAGDSHTGSVDGRLSDLGVTESAVGVLYTVLAKTKIEENSSSNDLM